MLDTVTTKEGYINLSDVKDIPHPELFDMVAKVIAEDNLQEVNRHSKTGVPRRSFYTKYGKRWVDILFSFVALVITAPINLIIAIITFFDVGKPILFKQVRVGKDGQIFEITKFRNMTNETDEHGVLLPPHLRVTKWGKFVRKTSLDELLNFWSVLKGDMSLIGPRPLLIDYLEVYSDRHKMRHAVRPGLECPALHPNNKRATWTDQFENDIEYVENVSFLLDVKMAFALVRMVIDRKDTAVRSSAQRGSFMGYNRDGTSIDSQNVPMIYYEKAIERIKKAGR